MGQSRERVCVERRQHTGNHARCKVAGPPPHEHRDRPPGERQTSKKKRVVSQDGGGAKPEEGRAHQRRDEQVFRVCERVPVWIKDVGVEQVKWTSRQLMRDPRDRPLVEHRIAVVVARQVPGVGHERPRVHERERGEQREAAQPWPPRQKAIHRRCIRRRS